MATRKKDIEDLRELIPDRKKFSLGRVMITPGAATEICGAEITRALWRHQCGDWGKLEPKERACNEIVLNAGGWLLSAYDDPETGSRFLIITQPDRMVTTVLIPKEFSE
jgi:hypothetical protein